jgi:peptidoglycan/LPS O-acetylase OafA/YrhL
VNTVGGTSTKRIEGLDALRGIAAAGVVAVHAAFMFPLGPNIPSEIGYLVLGVPLFFIVSAFSMSSAYSDGIKSSRAFRNYVIRRFSRIAPLFYALLALWLTYFAYLGSPPKSNPEILANVLFVFSFFPEYQVSIVPAGWSIGVEMVFYLFFPFLLLSPSIRFAAFLLLVSVVTAWAFNTAAAVPAVSDYYYWTHPLTNAPYFCFGILTWRVMNKYHAVMSSLATYGLLALGITLGLIMFVFGPTISSALTSRFPIPIIVVVGWGVAFSVIVLSQAVHPSAVLVNRATQFLGKISYSLYLSHPLLIYSTGLPLWIASKNSIPSLIAPSVISCALVLALPVAWILYRLIEVPFISVGRRLSSDGRSGTVPAA